MLWSAWTAGTFSDTYTALCSVLWFSFNFDGHACVRQVHAIRPTNP